MVAPFRFARIPEIFFRRGAISELPGLAGSTGKRIVLVTGERSFLMSPFYHPLINGLKEAGLEWFHVSISGEPSPDDIDSATASLKDKEPDLVISVGGGSVIDAGKAISAMLLMNEPVVNFLEGVGTKTHPGTKVPFIAVPTTSGTGSEATKNAVISSVGIQGFKKSLRHDNFVPDIALVDPQLTINCPREITAASGMDCFSQLTESYLSEKSSEFTNALAIRGLISLRDSLLRSYADGDDIEARTGMSFAALTSGICLANAGLGVVHGFASSIGGLYDIPHGLICGTLMAVSNKITVRELRKDSRYGKALSKYAELGRIFLGEQGRPDDFFIDGFIDYLLKVTYELNLPDLHQAGINESLFPQICDSTDCKNNPVRLERDHLSEILSMRYNG
jgi:alcohol dehydrogenase class IV